MLHLQVFLLLLKLHRHLDPLSPSRCGSQKAQNQGQEYSLRDPRESGSF